MEQQNNYTNYSTNSTAPDNSSYAEGSVDNAYQGTGEAGNIYAFPKNRTMYRHIYPPMTYGKYRQKPHFIPFCGWSPLYSTLQFLLPHPGQYFRFCGQDRYAFGHGKFIMEKNLIRLFLLLWIYFSARLSAAFCFCAQKRTGSGRAYFCWVNM